MEERTEMKQRINSTKYVRVKDQLRVKYSLLDRDTKSLAKAYKRAFVDGLTDEEEAAAGRQDVMTLYQINKVISGKYNSSCNHPVKNASGNIVHGENENRKRWQEHFEAVFYRPDPENALDITAADEPLDIDTNPSTLGTLKQLSKQWKNGKAGGLNGITAETPVILQCTLFQRMSGMTC